jgi:hypothetical protein
VPFVSLEVNITLRLIIKGKDQLGSQGPLRHWVRSRVGAYGTSMRTFPVAIETALPISALVSVLARSPSRVLSPHWPIESARINPLDFRCQLGSFYNQSVYGWRWFEHYWPDSSSLQGAHALGDCAEPLRMTVPKGLT